MKFKQSKPILNLIKYHGNLKSKHSGYKQLLIIPNSPAEQIDCSLNSSSQTAVSLSTLAPQSPQQRIKRCPKSTKPKL